MVQNFLIIYNLLLESSIMYVIPSYLSPMASSDDKSFLLVNNEIHNDTFLFGFELYGSQSGYINVKVNIMKISIATLEFIKINF